MGTPIYAGPRSESGIVSAIPRWRTEPWHADIPTTTEHERRIPADLVTGVSGHAQRLGVPMASALLAAHAKVLASLCGEQEVLTGYVAPDSGGGLRPCRLTVEDGAWRQLVLAAHAEARTSSSGTSSSGTSSSETPSSQAASPAAVPAYEVVLDLSGLPEAPGRPAPPDPAPSAGHADGGPPTGHTVLHIAFHAVPEEPHGLLLRVLGRGEVLDPPYARRVAGYYVTALELLAADSGAEHHRQSLLSPEELTHQIDGLAGPRRDLPDRRMHELFEERVRHHPDRIAAVHDGTEWTYGELNRRANRIAHALLRRGLRREDVVAVVTERNLDWMAAALAVFKAGGVYLPVEPHFPAGRIAAMLSRSDCRFVLAEFGSTETLDQALKGYAAKARLFITDAVEEREPGGEGPEDPRDADPGVPVSAGQLAYVYFTSGSTGEPKGAMCEHAGMLNHLFAKIEDLGMGPGQVVAQTAPQCFDISLWQLVSALLVGARTLIVGQQEILDIQRYVDALVDGEVEVLQVVPSYLEVMLTYLEERPRPLDRLRVVSATGEALKKELVERWFACFPDIKLVNAYGLTETSDDTNHQVMDGAPGHERVPLGPAVNNVRVYVVDDRLNPVPLGAPGEIVFSGVCVGRGYINDPERTAAAFGTDPHRPGERLYRSGDIGRWLPEGALEFLGRRDAQTKIRGFRIEIGEIENQLLCVPGVRDSAVVVAESPDQGKHLVAFYTADTALETDGLRQALGDVLPAYMVPHLFHHREALPLTGNGKIDKKGLTRQAAESATVPAAGDAGNAPRTAAEKRLAELWARVLNIPVAEISRDHHFFQSGGTSLSAVRLGVALGQAVTLEDIVSRPVLADLAAAMDENTQQGKEQSA
ncbi:non-ribosomal peptide synthetase [Streptomyces sp. LZ34]